MSSKWGMKKIIDFCQVLLLDDGGLGFVCWGIVAILLLQGIKLISAGFNALAWIWSAKDKVLFIPNTKGRWAVVLSVSAVAFLFRGSIVNQMQYVEQLYLRPTYVVADSSFWATSCYETEIKKHTTESEFNTVRDSTYSLAKELGCEPLAIYEVAQSECGMNPFCIRKDGGAAGWIQFTTNGLSDWPVTLSQVKGWCANRDAKAIMKMTGIYMRRWAKGRVLSNSTEVYCAVFAPGFICKPYDCVLYSGWWNAEYYKNAPALDGFVFKGEKVLRLDSAKDGKITKNDLTGALAYKKAKLLEKYRQ